MIRRRFFGSAQRLVYEVTKVCGVRRHSHSLTVSLKKKCQALIALRIHQPSAPAVELGVLQKLEASRPMFQALLIPSLLFFSFRTLLVTMNLADKVAGAGFYVVVPDFFYGDPFSPEANVPVWLKAHGTDKGFEDAKPIIAELRSKGINAIGAAGFCWGAKVVVELSKAGHIQAAVLLHPSLVTVDDIKEIKAPIAILGAENDHSSPPELLKQFEEVLFTKPEVNGYVKIFPGVAHGWSVRYKVEDEEAVKQADEAHQNTMDWFAQYVK